MTDRSVAVRLSTEGGGKVKAELQDVGEAGEKALKRIQTSTGPANSALRAIDATSQELQSSMNGFAGRLGPVGAGLASLGPAGLAAASAIGLFTVGIGASLREAEEATRVYNRLSTVLRATGYAAGLTAEDIEAFSEAQEKATLATAEQIQEAATVLATFRSVAGPTFTQTLKLAQDLSAVFGSDLRSATTQLGKALEDPVEGLSALRRVGVSFTQSQKDLIASLVESGQKAEAQQVILKALEKQVGGAAAGEATGLSGAVNRLTKNWLNLLEAVGKTEFFAGNALRGVDLLTRAVGGLETAAKGATIDQKIVALNRSIVQLEDDIADFRSNGLTEQDPEIATRLPILKKLRGDLDALIAEAKAQAGAFSEGRDEADQGRRDAERESRAEALANKLKAINEEIAKATTDPADKIAAVNEQLKQTKQQLNGLREADGSNAADVDAAVARAENLARRQIEAIEKPAREAAQRVTEQNQKVVEDLSRQIGGLTDKRQQFIDSQLARLPATADEDTKKRVRELAEQYLEQKDAVDDLNKALERQQKIMDDGKRVTEEVRTAQEVYNDELVRLNELLAEGAISQQTFDRASKEAKKTLDESSEAFQRAKDIGIEFGRATASGLEDALINFKDLRSVALGFIQDLGRIGIRNATAPIFEGFSTFLGGLFSAKGNAFDAGRLIPYANGGVVTRATQFPMRDGRTGVMGEAGPEAILPLQRLSNGNLGVLAGGANGGNVTISAPVSVTVTAPGGEPQANRDLAEKVGAAVKEAIKVEVVEEVINQLRPGNSLNDGRMTV